MIKMNKVSVDLAQSINESGAMSETHTNSITPQSPANQIGPIIQNEKDLNFASNLFIFIYGFSWINNSKRAVPYLRI